MCRPIRVGVSSCLVGEKVRYDGQDKLDPWVADVLGARFELVRVCPELEAGLCVPREPMRLVRAPDRIRLVGNVSQTDFTDVMVGFVRRRIEELRTLDLAGYVFKARSPSCGVFHVPVWQAEQETRDGTGLFARAFREAFPLVPIEEEGRLADPAVRESFVERVLAYARAR